MKNLNIIGLLLLCVVFVTTSCETDYDEYQEDRQPVVGFTGAVGGSNVNLGAGESTVKMANAWTSQAFATETTFDVMVVEDETVVTADNYQLGVVTFPAGERVGTFEVTFTNNSLPAEFSPVVFKIVNVEGMHSGASVFLQARGN